MSARRSDSGGITLVAEDSGAGVNRAGLAAFGDAETPNRRGTLERGRGAVSLVALER